MQTLSGIRVCPFHQAIQRSLSIQAVAVCSTRRLITSGFMVSLNHDIISLMGCLLSLALRKRSASRICITG